MLKTVKNLLCCVFENKDKEFTLTEYSRGKNEIVVEKIDPCISDNGTEHHTSRFQLMKSENNPQLIVRRGQLFKLQINLNRPYDVEKDFMCFKFTVKGILKPNYYDGTSVVATLLQKYSPGLSWNTVLGNVKGNILTVQVTPSADCIIGEWLIEIDTNHSGIYTWDNSFYILFNPWCKEDQVYLESDEWKDEAVLNNDGLIWRGSSSNFQPSIWKYSQFEKDILECALYLLYKIVKVPINAKGDAVQIARYLSAAVNLQNDNGVVVGNWSNKYSGGIAPTQWTGSLEILKQYYKTKKPVKYGQCWVFAGVLTTICRALGLPARVVTNFSSAHDSDGSVTIDNFIDENGETINVSSDSIWNFHVWTEVWMKRYDLGDYYDGWQAIDSTPQEESDGIYRCGPASVVACKEGEVKKPFDLPFVFAEVNADIIHWRYNSDDRSLKLLRKNTEEIGKFISTKSPGRFERLDITDTYKYKEFTDAERDANLKAIRLTEHRILDYYVNESFEDIIFELKYLDDIIVGNPFDVSLIMTNRNPENHHNVNAVLRVDKISYTGKVVTTVKVKTFDTVVKVNSREEMKLNVSFEEYYQKLSANTAFRITCLANVEGTNYDHHDRHNFRVKMPSIQIALDENVKQGKEVTADIIFTNPLPIPLKKSKFFIEAPSNYKEVKIKHKILPEEKLVKQFKFTPSEPGKQTIAVKFSSKELCDVDGFLHYNVDPV